MLHVKGYATFLMLGMLSLYQGAAFAAPSAGKNVELAIEHGETTIVGTLTLPHETQSGALVIMLSGSGPQDRDETLDGFRVFLHLAEHLSEQGIASFRFDDRGVGGSSGNFGQSKLSDHANDVIRILNYFAEHNAHGFRGFILLGIVRAA
ncbi:alpha/beta hydrolase family protein [Alteromonas halophila]|uniref:Serine aminopeptidase S33 domain-containing protein n=1 Tax=Alteromonas halophila TaxID=516698 RepID=A0A918JFI4_9ALTE|nr:alpha/beta hydrolase [Alteromonas halophila]GGW76244.1 hypothetical protein GCM10007391_05990 [Alteromonas halophila]